jgi:hypothetical protein
VLFIAFCIAAGGASRSALRRVADLAMEAWPS